MRNSFKTILCLLMLGVLFFSNIACASSVTPRADTEFVSAYPSLKTTQDVTFRCTTYQTKASLSVTDCWLELYVNGSWVRVCDLTPPSYVAYNTFSYTETVDYSAQIGTGTFRVWATFNADGHEITRCSNERTF